MKAEELLFTIKGALSKKTVEQLAEIAGGNNFSVRELIDATFHQEDQVAFRAAWILENVFTASEEKVVPEIPSFLRRFSSQHNPSCRRHFTKLLAMMTSRKASPPVKAVLDTYPTEELVEITFSWLIDAEVQVAIKSHCLNILANLCDRHDWIKEELIATMEFLVDKESIAFYGKVKQIRKQLKQNMRANASVR